MKKTTKRAILIGVVAVAVLAAAITGTVMFMKDSGEAEARGFTNETNTALPVTGSDEGNIVNNTVQPENEGTMSTNNAVSENETVTPQEPTTEGQTTQQETINNDVTTNAGSTTGTTTSNTQEPDLEEVIVLGEERVVEETADVSWRNVDLDATIPEIESTTITYITDVEATKTNSLPEGEAVEVGDTFTYTLTIENTGNIAKEVHITDTVPTQLQIHTATLPENAVVTENVIDFGTMTVLPGNPIVITFEVTVLEISAQPIQNKAEMIVDGEKTPFEDEEIPTYGYTLDKTASLNKKEGNTIEGKAQVGDTISYAITIVNTGSTDIIDLEVTDPMYDKTTVKVNVAVGETKIIPYAYTVTQEDIDNQKAIENTVTAGDKQDTTTTEVEEKAPALTVTKVADKTEDLQVGETVTYTITVKNTGNVTLHHIAVTDTIKGNIALELKDANGNVVTNIDTLAPNAEVTLYATYTVTQADIDNQVEIVNSAVATADDGTTNKGEETIIPEEEAPALTVTKVADKTEGLQVNDVVTYTITVKNTGNVTLHHIAVTDTIKGNIALELKDANGNVVTNIDTLAPNAEVTLYATYTVTQTDIDNQVEIVNSAVATADNGTTNKGEETITPEEDAPALTVIKEANKTENAKVGDVITYTITVKNTGNVTLHNINVTDTIKGNMALELKDADGNVVNHIETLAPDETVTVYATYTVLQADMDAQNTLINVVTATAEDGTYDEDNATTQIEAKDTGLLVTKTADKTEDLHVNDVVTYTITVKNTGNVTLHNITVTDTIKGNIALELKDADGKVVTNIENLAPNAEVTLYATYTVTQTDIDNQVAIVNSAVAKADDGTTGKGEETITPEEDAPALTVTKVADKTEGLQVGETVTYTITVKNTGNVTLHHIAVTDTIKGNIALELKDANGNVVTNIDTLAPNAEVTLYATYTVTQADIDNQVEIVNSAVATADDGTTNKGKETITPEEDAPSICVEKIANITTGAKVNDVITYTITVTNTGNTTLQNIVLTDTIKANQSLTLLDEEGNVVTQITSLAPNASRTFTTTYTVTQADIDAQASIANSVIAVAEDGTNDTGVAVTTVEEKEPELTVTKTADKKEDLQVNDVVTYTITVKNTGNVTLYNIEVNDTIKGNIALELKDAAGKVVTNIETLAPNVQITLYATYTVTQADIDNQVAIVNSAVAEADDGTPGKGEETIIPEKDAPALTVTKEADKTEGLQVGETVTYTITVENTGNVTLHNINVTDTIKGNIPLKLTDADGNVVTNIATLAPNAKVTLTATYTALQEDIDAQASLVNVATATADDGTTAKDDATTTVVDDNPGLTVDKNVNKAVDAKVNDVLAYSIVVTNSGNVTLHNIAITDTIKGNIELELKDAQGNVVTNIDTLAPNATVTVYATYTVTQEDIDNQTDIVNSVVAQADDGTKNSDDVTTTVEEDTPGLTVIKEADKTEDLQVNDVVTYTITVENTGNVTLHNIAVSDTIKGNIALELKDADGNVVTNINTLAPDAVVTLYATYTVTQADMDNQVEIVNSAVATADDGTTNKGEETIIPEKDAPALTVTKVADKTEGLQVNDVVTYTITVENTGNVTLHNINVTDTIKGNIVLELKDADGKVVNKIDTLAPDAVVTLYATYTVTQADIDNQVEIVNSAVATAEDGTTNEGEEIITTEDDAPALTVKKEANKTENAKVGDVIIYTITVQNTGNVTLHNIAVNDTIKGNVALDLKDDKGNVVTNIATLAPDAKVTLTATYTVLQADIDAQATIVNTATATADNGTNDQDDATTTVEQTDTGLSVVKTASKDSGLTAGETVTYTITVKNTGNTTLKNIAVKDTLKGNIALDLKDDKGNVVTKIDTLAPNVEVTLYATYTVTQDDVDAQKTIVNSATAKAEDGTEGKGDETITVEQKAPALLVEKTASKDSGLVVGETVTYTITVENTGNVTLHNINVTDTIKGNIVLELKDADGKVVTHIDTLAPDAVVTLYATYTVTQADVDNQVEIVNSAVATAEDGTTHEGIETITPIEDAPGLFVTKTPSISTGAKLGDVITYAITVENTGNTTLKNVALTDVIKTHTPLTLLDEQGNTISNIATLAPGEVRNLTTTYTVIQEDIDAQLPISNSATARAEDGTNSTGVAVTTVAAEDPGIVIEKSVAIQTKATGNTVVDKAQMGDTLTYTIMVKNTGNVTLHNVTVVDTMIGLHETLMTLAPNATKTYTVDYTVTKAKMLEAGNVITNVAVADSDETQQTSDEVTINKEPFQPIIGKNKTSNTGVAEVTVAPGEDITYTIEVWNDGFVPATNVVVTDTIPVGTTFKAAGNGGIYDEATGVVTWTIPTIAAEGGRTSVTLTVTVNELDDDTVITNTGKVNGDDTPTETDIVKNYVRTITGVEHATAKTNSNIVLVLDLSSSMTLNGRTRLEDAKDAMVDFIENIYTDATISGVNIRVVTFNSENPLTETTYTGIKKCDKMHNHEYNGCVRINRTWYSEYTSTTTTVPYSGTQVLSVAGLTNNTATNYAQSQLLVDAIEAIAIPEGYQQGGFGTHMRAALDEAYTQISSLKTAYPTNNNMVIFLGDGTPESSYSNNTPDEIRASANNIKGLDRTTLYTISFAEYVQLLSDIADTGCFYEAEDKEDLLEDFEAISDTPVDNPVKEDSDNGYVTIDTISGLKIDDTHAVTLTVNGTTVGSFTTLEALNASGYISYNSTSKQLVWNVRGYAKDAVLTIEYSIN